MKKNNQTAHSKSEARRIAIMLQEPCMCRIHILLEKDNSSIIPCVGHGAGCPCTEAQKKEQKNEPEKV